MGNIYGSHNYSFIKRRTIMKKLFVLLLTLTFLFTFFGCQEAATESDGSESTNNSSESEAVSDVSDESIESGSESSDVSDESSEIMQAEIPDKNKVLYNPIEITLKFMDGGGNGFVEQKDNSELTVSKYLKENDVPDGYYFYVSLQDDSNGEENRVKVRDLADKVGLIIDESRDNHQYVVYGYCSPECFYKLADCGLDVMLAWENEPEA